MNLGAGQEFRHYLSRGFAGRGGGVLIYGTLVVVKVVLGRVPRERRGTGMVSDETVSDEGVEEKVSQYTQQWTRRTKLKPTTRYSTN